MKLFSKILYGLCMILWFVEFVGYCIGHIIPNPFNIGFAMFMTFTTFLRWFVQEFER